MYPSHEEAPGPREVPWLNGRPATAAETPVVERARQAERDRETRRLLAGVLTTADRPGVKTPAKMADEAVQLAGGLL
jgi:hypothetical protein